MMSTPAQMKTLTNHQKNVTRSILFINTAEKLGTSTDTPCTTKLIRDVRHLKVNSVIIVLYANRSFPIYHSLSSQRNCLPLLTFS